MTLIPDPTKIHSSLAGLDDDKAVAVSGILTKRLAATLDLQLVLKHIHWNVVGPNFIAVHEMLDDHVDKAREMTDDIAERIRTLGGVPQGTPQAIIDHRTWSDYAIGRANWRQHLYELDKVYDGMIADHREAIAQTGDLDPITEDLLIAQTATLELFQWFVRSHLDDGTV